MQDWRTTTQNNTPKVSVNKFKNWKFHWTDSSNFVTRIVDFSERMFHKTLPALSEQFLTSSPPTSQNFPLFHSSLVRWKWAHLGGGFHKPDVFLPPFPPSSHYSDYQHCHSEHLGATPTPQCPLPQSCFPNLMWPGGLRWCADAAFPRDGERQRWLFNTSTAAKSNNGAGRVSFTWISLRRSSQV